MARWSLGHCWGLRVWAAGRRDWPSCSCFWAMRNQSSAFFLKSNHCGKSMCPWQCDPGPANEAVMKLQSSHAFGQGVLVFQTSAVLGVVTGVSHSLCALWEWVGLVYPRQFRVWLQCEGLGAFCCPGLSQQCHLVLPSPGWRFSAVLGPALLGNVLNSPCVVHEAFWT